MIKQTGFPGVDIDAIYKNTPRLAKKHLSSDEHDTCKSFWKAAQLFKWSSSLHRIVNEGKRSRFVIARLKGEGFRAGIWDYFLSYPTEKHHGLWIEFKSTKGRLTKEQQAFGLENSDHGYDTLVAKSAAEAIIYINDVYFK